MKVSRIFIILLQVPEPVPARTHLFKYRVFYGKDGRRIVGFDTNAAKAIIVISTAPRASLPVHNDQCPPVRFSEGDNQEEAETMREALIQIRADSETALDEAFDRATSAMRSGNPSEPVAVFTFSSPAQLFSVITPKRWELIEHLQKIGPSSIRGLARSVERDVKRVHEDVSALSDWGIFEQTEDGKVHVPYDAIHANFDLGAAA